MVCGDTILIHADPGSDHQHGSPGCSQDIGENGPNQQEDNVVEWSGFAFDSDMDPTRDHVEGAHQGDKAHILNGCMGDRVIGVKPDQIVAKSDRSQHIGYLGIMFFPPMQEEQGPEGNHCQQQPKGQHHPGIGNDGFTVIHNA